MIKKIAQLALIAFISFVLSGCTAVKSVVTFSLITFKAKNFKTEIPFNQLYSLIQLKAGLNGSNDRYDFVFDTGAGATAISKKIADSLKLKKIGEITVRDALGNKKVNDVVRIPELDMNGLKFYDLGAVVEEFGKYSPVNCIGKDGIIGVNIISCCNWTIDYQNKKLTATDSSLNFPPTAISLPFKSDVPFIDLTIGKTVLHHVMVDLGSNESVTIPESVLKQNPGINLGHSQCRKIDANTQGINGPKEDTAMVCISDSIKLDGSLYSHIRVATASSYLLKIGADFWDKNLVGIDYHNRKIFLVKNPAAQQKNKLRGFGFRIGIKDDKYYVNLVFEHSPAANSGIKINDEVEAVNGTPVNRFFGDYCGLMSWEANIMDEQKEMNIKLKESGQTIYLKRSDYGTVE